MWIISKTMGLFNVRNFTRIFEDHGVTYGDDYVISMEPILNTITEALKRGYPFLEVE